MRNERRHMGVSGLPAMGGGRRRIDSQTILGASARPRPVPAGSHIRQSRGGFQTSVNPDGACAYQANLIANTLTITTRGYFLATRSSSKSNSILIFI